MTKCPFCWGSHGCDLDAGHGPGVGHVCIHPVFDGDGALSLGIACSTRPSGDPELFHWKTDEPEVVAT